MGTVRLGYPEDTGYARDRFHAGEEPAQLLYTCSVHRERHGTGIGFFIFFRRERVNIDVFGRNHVRDVANQTHPVERFDLQSRGIGGFVVTPRNRYIAFGVFGVPENGAVASMYRYTPAAG